MPHLAGTGSGSTLQTLVHSSLGIQSMLQKSTLKHNTTERDHILVPPNFDSWGKIRILTADFNVEAVSEAWMADISTGLPAEDDQQATTDASESEEEANGESSQPAVAMYEEFIRNPQKGDILLGTQPQKQHSGIDVESQEVQAFLSEQAERLDDLAKKDEQQLSRDAKKPAGITASAAGNASGDVQEHIGTVQFNVGGIQMDVDQALRQLNVGFLEHWREMSQVLISRQNREAETSTEPEAPSTPTISKEDDKALNEKYRSFFAGLTKKSAGSATNSPRRGPEGH